MWSLFCSELLFVLCSDSSFCHSSTDLNDFVVLLEVFLVNLSSTCRESWSEQNLGTWWDTCTPREISFFRNHLTKIHRVYAKQTMLANLASHLEPVLHILVQCPFAQICWRRNKSIKMQLPANTSSVLNCFEWHPILLKIILWCIRQLCCKLFEDCINASEVSEASKSWQRR